MPQRPRIDADVLNGMRLMGATPEDIEKARAQMKPADEEDAGPGFDVWPENWVTVMFFLGVSTQWHHVSGMAVARTGLSRCEVEAEMRLRRVPVAERAELLDGLAVMEHAVLQYDAEARAREGAHA